MVAAAASFGEVAEQRKGGFLIRVGAAVIDGIIIGVVGAILQQVLGAGVGGGLTTLGSIAYFIYFWSTTGQTIGHRALGLKVVKMDGSKLDITTAALRYVGQIIAAIPVGLGFLWVIWDAQKQGWHDKIAKTYVVHV